MRKNFEDLVGKIPFHSCWEWLGKRTKKGYGIASLGRRGWVARAHRVAWERAHGPITRGLHVLHSCDNPGCVRPDHLFLGTNADNMRDRDAKGRVARGERSGTARYPDSLVRMARASTATVGETARALGVAHSWVSMVRSGRRRMGGR